MTDLERLEEVWPLDWKEVSGLGYVSGGAHMLGACCDILDGEESWLFYLLDDVYAPIGEGGLSEAAAEAADYLDHLSSRRFREAEALNEVASYCRVALKSAERSEA